ncbi:MAG: hypothetical protein RL522_2442 [Pseudomonadota bacterium]|jgi:Xaa-Pro dipeptidase
MAGFELPAGELTHRRDALFAAMDRRGLSAFLVFHPTSLHWLTGSQAKGYQAFQCLLVHRPSARLVMFTRESEINEWRDEAQVDDLHAWGGPAGNDPIDGFLALTRSLGLEGRTTAMEVPAYYLHPHHYLRLKAGLDLGPDSEQPNLVSELRMVKSAHEIACIREAARVADQCMATVRDALAAGRSERQVAAALYATAMAQGADLPTVPINLVSGPRAGYSHGSPTLRQMERGDHGNAEFCIPFNRHTVSLGRTFCLGPPAARVAEVHAIVRAAADACIAVLREGTPAGEAFRAASEVIDGAGLQAHRVHTLGYGVAAAFAPATGEPLQLAPGSPTVIRAGMLLSICPNVFIGEERLGVRLVDNVLVTRSGAEILSTFSRDMIVAP